jgi:hypothetical protein
MRIRDIIDYLRPDMNVLKLKIIQLLSTQADQQEK